MITAKAAYNKLKSRLGNKFVILDGFEISDAYIFSVIDNQGNGGYPFYSVTKNEGLIGGYNPMYDIDEFEDGTQNHPIDVTNL